MIPTWLGAILAAAAALAAGRALNPGRRRQRSERGMRRGSRSDRRLVAAGHPLEPSGVPRRAGQVVIAVAVVLAAVLFGPTWVGAGVGSAALARVVLVRRRRQLRTEAIDRAVPELIDLLRVAAAAGHPVRSCLDAVGPRAPDVLQPVLAATRRQLDGGASLRASLEPATAGLGAMGPALVDALLASQRTGAPLAESLARMAGISRDLRRRRAEARARKLPVALLFPLVCCVLPAFALLAVVPLLAGSLGSLRP